MTYVLGTLICEDDKYENISGDNHQPGIQTSIDDIYYTHVNWSSCSAVSEHLLHCRRILYYLSQQGSPYFTDTHFFLKFSQIIIFMDITD